MVCEVPGLSDVQSDYRTCAEAFYQVRVATRPGPRRRLRDGTRVSLAPA
jgi:hypothetical protein